MPVGGEASRAIDGLLLNAHHVALRSQADAMLHDLGLGEARFHRDGPLADAFSDRGIWPCVPDPGRAIHPTTCSPWATYEAHFAAPGGPSRKRGSGHETAQEVSPN